MTVVRAAVWAGRGLWRRLTGARSAADGSDGATEPRGAPEAAENRTETPGYREAA